MEEVVGVVKVVVEEVVAVMAVGKVDRGGFLALLKNFEVFVSPLESISIAVVSYSVREALGAAR